MPDNGSATTEMPTGVYLTLTDSVREHAGGQTRAMIMRNRLITRHTGTPTTVLTVESKPVYPAVRASLEEQGQLIDGMRLLNVYEWYRDQPLPDEEPDDGALGLGGALPQIAEVTHTVDVAHPDGSVYRTEHYRGELEVAHDYRRADGTVYLRRPAGPTAEKHPVTPYVLVGHDGRPVRTWRKVGGWHWHWLRWLAGDAERVFLVTDSRFALGDLLPRADDRFYLLHLIHNNHTVGERRWDSTLSPDYEPLFDRMRMVDGLVTLTERQSEDVAQRFGRSNNLFVVPNPVELPELPETLPERARADFVIVSRLEGQKRLHHAIEAFALVVAKRPEATLRIYGNGKQRPRLERRIDELGVGDQVRLMGFDPLAKRELMTATGFLMTSVNEGYPLATLESMSFGCPVVSYDIKYGPRDQVTDGVDGFIVPAGDIEAVAERCVQMIDSPALVAELSRNALLKAADHDWRRFLRDWKHAFETAVAQRPHRVRQARGELEVHELGWVEHTAASRLLPGRFRPPAQVRTDSGTTGGAELVFSGTLRVTGRWQKGALKSRVLSLDAVCPDTGDVVALPLQERSSERGVFHLDTRFDLDSVFAGMAAESRSVRLRLRFTAQNYVWETDLARPATARPARLEVAVGPDDVLHVQRRGAPELP